MNLFQIHDWPLWQQLWLAGGAFLAAYYFWLMYRYGKYWKKIPVWNIPEKFIPQTSVTVLVPARNEAENIEACIQSLLHQNYAAELLEVIVLDDHSTDNTAQVVKAISNNRVRLLSLTEIETKGETIAFKKRAIEAGIEQANGKLIYCTDADCKVPPNCLALLVSYYEKYQPVFIAGPVNFYKEKSKLQRFQSLDFLGMMGITGAGIYGAFQHMCNGANLAYEQEAFEKVNGFSGIDGRASGDDMLLLQKMARAFPGRIGFIKNPEATVLTEAMPTLKRFLNQRIRWASKSRDYSEKGVSFNLAMVFFFCWYILLSLALAPFLGFTFLWIFIGFVLLKAIADFIFLKPMSKFFHREDLMNSFGISFIFHVLYIASVGLMANFVKSYEWKGRRVR